MFTKNVSINIRCTDVKVRTKLATSIILNLSSLQMLQCINFYNNIHVKSTTIQKPKARSTSINHLHTLNEKATVMYRNVRKRFQPTPLNHIQAPSQRPPTYTQSIYDDAKYTIYREWRSSNTPPHPNPTPHQLIHKHTTFTNPSDMDNEFLLLIQQLHPTLQHRLGIIQAITHLPLIIQALENGELIGVCDAASHAYKFITKNEKHHIWGTAPINCDEDDTDSSQVM